MKYTAKIFTFDSTGNTKAFAKLIIDGVIEIDGFKVINGKTGLFVGFPSQKMKEPKDGREYVDTLRLLDYDEENVSGTKNQIVEAILDAYNSTVTSQVRNATNKARASVNGSEDETPKTGLTRPKRKW